MRKMDALPLHTHSFSRDRNRRTQRNQGLSTKTVALVFVASCVCYSLIAYAYFYKMAGAPSPAKRDVDDGPLPSPSPSTSKRGGGGARDQQNMDRLRQHQLEQEKQQKTMGEQLELEQQTLQAGVQGVKEAQGKDVGLQDQQPSNAPVGDSLYDFEAYDIHGRLRSLSEFKSKAVIVTNVASKCGYTDTNYKGLQSTYEKYHPYGLEILAFPCDQFGHQEPGSEDEIKGFCADKYGVSFPMFSKVDVNGPSAHPLFKFLKSKLPVGKDGNNIGWNFFKFIVNGDGKPVKVMNQSYNRAQVEQEVYKLLMT